MNVRRGNSRVRSKQLLCRRCLSRLLLRLSEGRLGGSGREVVFEERRESKERRGMEVLTMCILVVVLRLLGCQVGFLSERLRLLV